MIKNNIKKAFLNKFFKKIMYKKQYINKLNNKVFFLNKNSIKKYNKKFSTRICKSFLISYIIEILFNKTNTLTQITDSFGRLKFFCSAGHIFFKGKSKKARVSIIKNILKILVKKLIFLKNKPLILRVKNVGLKKN
jgi:hypothetical protein